MDNSQSPRRDQPEGPIHPKIIIKAVVKRSGSAKHGKKKTLLKQRGGLVLIYRDSYMRKFPYKWSWFAPARPMYGKMRTESNKKNKAITIDE